MATETAGSGCSVPMNAILIGGTGATGGCLLGALLRSKDKVGKVTVLTRRKVEGVPENYGVNVAEEEQEGRLVQHVEDLDSVSEDTIKQFCSGGDVFFNCLGTTRRNAGSAEAFRHIDCEIPLRLIKVAKAANVCHCSVLTSVGANPNSWFLYFKSKGVLEESVKEVKFSYTSIFRPGVLDKGQPQNIIGKLFARLMGGISVSAIADAMLHDAWLNHVGSQKEGGTASAAASNVAVYDNAAIGRLSEESKKDGS